MTPNVVFDHLLLVGLVLICFVIYVWGLDPSRATPSRSRKPDQRRRKRSTEPQPFTGYLHKPLCEACEHSADTPSKMPSSPPPLLTCSRGRKRTVDTQAHCYPQPTCAYHGWLGRGTIRANGHPGGQPWRPWQCLSCHSSFSATTGTIFHSKRASPDLIVRVVACLAEGLDIRGTARVFEIDPHTVLSWLVEASEQLQALSASLPRSLSRLNLSLRQRVAAIGRRSATSCKHEDGLHHQLALFQTYHNLVLPHASLRQALPEPVPTRGQGSAKEQRHTSHALQA